MRRYILPFLLFGTILSVQWDSFAAPFLSAYDRVMAAVRMRDEDFLRQMLSHGLNINASNPSGQTPLCTVIRNNDVNGYKMLFKNGASVHVSCMRQIPPQVLSSFYTNNPDLGVYDGKQVLLSSDETDDSPTILAGIPWPHVGEFILGGLAVGIVASVGSGGDSEDTPSQPEAEVSLFKPVDTGLTKEDFPELGAYYDDKIINKIYTLEEVNNLKKNYKNEVWDNATSKAKEYNGWNGWNGFKTNKDETTEYYLVNTVPLLPMVNAASAYVRGYTGKVVDRTDPANPKVTDEKVKVAVFDTGLEVDNYAHEELKDNISKTRLNFVYGPCTKANSKKCWRYENGIASLIEGDQREPIKTASMEEAQWILYSMAFAPECSDTNKNNCLKATEREVQGNYEVQYFWDDPTKPQSAIIVSKSLWNEYKEKYGQNGYVYDENDPTPAILFAGELDQKSRWYSVAHGTQLSGIIAAMQNDMSISGVAPDAEIIPVRLDQFMGMDIQYLRDVVEKTDARVVNLSLGTEGLIVENGKLINYSWTENDYWKAYEEEAVKKGTVFVFAAGNEGASQPSSLTLAPLIGDSNSLDSLKTNFENSIYKNLLISVIAVDENKKITDYSNRCGASSMYCLAAPGGTEKTPIGTTSLGKTYEGVNGTSMATPVISGSVALLMGAFPHLTSQQVVQILFETADYITPTDKEISDYNQKALADAKVEDAYNKFTQEGNYNAIYGHGLVNLDKATDPVGLVKINFDTVASSDNAVPVSKTSLVVPNNLSNVLGYLPQNIVVLDKYARSFAFKTSNMIRIEKRSDALKRSFQSFMASDETKIQFNDALNFAFTSAPTDSVGLPVGSLSMDLFPSSDVKVHMGYTQDTNSFGGTYAERLIQNPFINMRQAWGMNFAWNMTGNLFLTGGGQYGQNGFIDSDTLENMEHKPNMHVLQTGLRYTPKKSVVFDMSFGQMNEEESLMGMYGNGAFDTDGNQTQFVSFATRLRPFENWQLSASYTYGITNSNEVNSLMKFSRLTSDAFAMNFTYTPDDRSLYGFKIVSPLRVRSGTVSFDLPMGRDMYEDKLYRAQYTSNMKPEAREYDLSLFFKKQPKENLFFAGEMGVRLNPDHQERAEPDWRTLFKMNWEW